ncbi:phosphotransferase family protein [Rhodospirillaceae bacterium KN72]|uniref:Phosphotransferase family protein n=1 Tax=Pacificispira spongiicola TaxID=2729598 RepID=A0A7Y0DYG1_9PROT|nr:phosphotransferase family protein [Pacificispira spongiicola]NMM43888.1 phosphotransferase family protein [Pacificispira spongiicola]
MTGVGLAGNAEAQARVAESLKAPLLATDISIDGLWPLSGGAIQENWAVDLTIQRESGGPERLECVLRTDSPTGVEISLGRAQEFELLRAAWDLGVTVPEPMACVTDKSVIGKDFCLMRRVRGTALGQKITRDERIGGDRDALTERLGRELARIHKITPKSHRFDFLQPPPIDAAEAELAAMRGFLDKMGAQRPVLEWAFRWLYRHKPAPAEIVLAHHDFRTGNYMLDEAGLTAILDWEFAGWSDRHEDIGWFHGMCWRFARRDLPAGGIGTREAFRCGYEAESGISIDPRKAFWWEVYAHLRWAVIALQQVNRYLVGGERTLDLGLTGRRPAELELEILRMTAPERTGA